MNKVVLSGLLASFALVAYAAQVTENRAELVIIDEEGHQQRAHIAEQGHEQVQRSSENFYITNFMRLKVAGMGNDFYIGLNDMDGVDGEAIDFPEARCLKQALAEGLLSEIRVSKRNSMEVYRSLGVVNPFRAKGSYISSLQIKFRDGSVYSPSEAHTEMFGTAGGMIPESDRPTYNQLSRSLCKLVDQQTERRVSESFEAQSQNNDGTH
jgi:hypothetical protein